VQPPSRSSSALCNGPRRSQILARICRSEPQIVASDRTQLHTRPEAKITNAGHFRRSQGLACGFSEWGGWDSNPRPTDYECATGVPGSLRTFPPGPPCAGQRQRGVALSPGAFRQFPRGVFPGCSHFIEPARVVPHPRPPTRVAPSTCCVPRPCHGSPPWRTLARGPPTPCARARNTSSQPAGPDGASPPRPGPLIACIGGDPMSNSSTPTSTGPWRLLILDRDPDDPKWVMATGPPR
jgi:hypothetical protein